MNDEMMETKEFNYRGIVLNGFVALFLHLIILPLLFFGMMQLIKPFLTLMAAVGITLVMFFFILMMGYFSMEPNEARVMIYFGEYRGTFKRTGFFWINPLMQKKRLSLRARNLDAEPIKVNDKTGNPILIGMVLVWKLQDTYRAMFEIDSQVMAEKAKTQPVSVGERMNAFEQFVRVQSEAALRQVAGEFAYDDPYHETDELTLHGQAKIINEDLIKRLDERVAIAGIRILDARINYLAYAPEIAAVMLRRQQAGALLAARAQILEGAVDMIKKTISRLGQEKIVELDETKKAALVSNLLVVLCADDSVHPVLNADKD